MSSSSVYRLVRLGFIHVALTRGIYSFPTKVPYLVFHIQLSSFRKKG